MYSNIANDENYDPNGQVAQPFGLPHLKTQFSQMLENRDNMTLSEHLQGGTARNEGEEEEEEAERARQEEEFIEAELAAKVKERLGDLELDLMDYDDMDNVDGVLENDHRNFHSPVNPDMNEENNQMRGHQKDLSFTGQYLNAENSQDELRLLYEARGQKILDLERDFNEMKGSHDKNLRLLEHENGICKSETEQYHLKYNEVKKVLDSVIEVKHDLQNKLESCESEMCKFTAENERLNIDLKSSHEMNAVLQSQLQDLQKSESLVKIRDHYDSLMGSMQEKHKAQVHDSQRNCSEQANMIVKYENEIRELNARIKRMSATHEEQIASKCESIDALSRKIEDMSVSTSSMSTPDIKLMAKIQLDENLIKSLTRKLEENENIRNSLNKDLDRLKVDCEQSNKLKNVLSSENERLKLTVKELECKISDSESSKLRDCVKPQNDLPTVESYETKIKHLECVVKEKEAKLADQEQKITALIKQWEAETEKIKENHGVDRHQLEMAKCKYSTLKMKVREYQKHVRRREEELKGQIETLNGSFAESIKGYKTTLQHAYQTRQKEIECELLSLQAQFDEQVAKVAASSTKCHQ